MSAIFTQSPWAVDPQTFQLFELSVVMLVVAFVIVFIMGVFSNLNVARSVASTLEDALSEQFVRFGNEDGKKLTKDGQAYYWFHATGRKYTPGMSVFMDLVKRMDIFSYTSSFMNSPQRDRLTFYIPIFHNIPMEPISLLVVRKKELPRLKDMYEGASFAAVESLAAEVVELDGMPSDFAVMSEHREIVNALLPKRIQTIFAVHNKNILSIHVTEQGALWEPQSRLYKKLIRIECSLPMSKRKQAEFLQAMSGLAIHLLDTAVEMKLSGAARKKAVDLRQEVIRKKEREEQKRRAEEATERRLAKKKEEEEAVKKMSRQKQMKYEEKKRKKEYSAKLKKASRK